MARASPAENRGRARGIDGQLIEKRNEYRPAGRERAGLATRRIAAAALDRVVMQGHGLDRLFDERSGMAGWRALIAKDRALARAIVTTAVRRRRQLECALSHALDRRLPEKARHLHSTLHVAVAQILFMDVPDSAAVDLAVTSLHEDRRSARFAGLGNAVLRRIVRERDQILSSCDLWQLAFVPWLGKRIRADFGRRRAERIADAVLFGAPLDLTLSPLLEKERRTELLAALDGVALPSGSVRIFHLTPVRQLPGYLEGHWWVQDVAASLPALMLGQVKGLEVADLCAAPGGKTAQLAAAGARVTAVDRSRDRLLRLKRNLDRLGLEADLVEADIERWRPGRTFDAVLLDAPCSATGTIRRHPDAAWTKSEESVNLLAARQRRLLRSAIDLTRPGGRLVYANCSLLKQEGEDIAAEFAQFPEIAVAPLEPHEIPGTENLINGQGALRTLPCDQPLYGRQGGMDGFFAIRFEIASKKSGS